MGVSRIDNEHLAMNLLFTSRRDLQTMGIETVKHVDSTGINRLAVRFQKLHFMKSVFVKIQKLKNVKSRF